MMFRFDTVFSFREFWRPELVRHACFGTSHFALPPHRPPRTLHTVTPHGYSTFFVSDVLCSRRDVACPDNGNLPLALGQVCPTRRKSADVDLPAVPVNKRVERLARSRFEIGALGVADRNQRGLRYLSKWDPQNLRCLLLEHEVKGRPHRPQSSL